MVSNIPAGVRKARTFFTVYTLAQCQVHTAKNLDSIMMKYANRHFRNFETHASSSKKEKSGLVSLYECVSVDEG